jgi:tetratricopeptide (TPR) repeat protein
MGGILVADTNFKFCAACGRKVALNAQFCAGCGAVLGAKEKSVQAPTQKASAAAPVKKETTPKQKGLTAREWNDKGVALAKSGRNQEAISCYEKALELDLKLVGALVNKGIALDDLHRYEEALQCFDKALAINPKSAAAWTYKGGALNKSGRSQEALQCCDRALAIAPQNVFAERVKNMISASK